uniref:Uncharacterized protein n=1 Tax=Marmota marmota marmota TaxID=9994 RepID=A0A8C6A4S4_MARMA
MGSSGQEGLPPQLSQQDQDADLLDNTDATRPPVPSPEGPPLEGDQQSPSTGQGPFFYIGGTNGASIVSAYCRSRGWQRTQDGRRADCKLKWCEVKCRDSYCSFREGQQLLFQLPNNKLLTTKIGLLTALTWPVAPLATAPLLPSQLWLLCLQAGPAPQHPRGRVGGWPQEGPMDLSLCQAGTQLWPQLLSVVPAVQSALLGAAPCLWS